MRSLGRAILLLCLGCGTKAPPGESISPHVVIETRTIVTTQLQPNLMLLLDRSSSMLLNTSTAAPCPSTIGGCGPSTPCPSNCPTRISDLKSALGQMLSLPTTAHRVGVTVFPADNLCAPAAQSEVLLPLLGPSLTDDPIALQAQASAANDAVQSVTTGGGSPTADSLRFVGTLAEMGDTTRQDFVLLFTAGVLDCTNADDSVAAVNELRAKNIKTIVFTFNADVATPNTTSTLNRLASAGGFARACPMGTDAECGAADTCEVTTKLCHQSFFSADDSHSLAEALTSIVTLQGNRPDLCSIQLENNPVDVQHLTVLVQGQLQAPCASDVACNTWVFEQSGGRTTVHFEGETCDAIQKATALTPLTLTFKIQQ